MAVLRTVLADLFMLVSSLLLWIPEIALAGIDRVAGTRLAAAQIRWWCRWVFRLLGVRVVGVNSERIDPKRHYVILANHRSHLDGPAAIVALPLAFGFLVKRSLTLIPAWGWAIWTANYIPVDRGNPRAARQSLELAAQRVAGGVNILVFPEGTRSPDGELLPFKKGGVDVALRAGADILPVSIVGSRALLPKGRLYATAGTIQVVVHEPVATAGHSAAQREALLAEVRRRIAAVDTERSL